MTEDKKEPRKSTVAFEVDETPKDKKPVSKKRVSTRASLRSSFFRLKSLVFRKYVFEVLAAIKPIMFCVWNFNL